MLLFVSSYILKVFIMKDSDLLYLFELIAENYDRLYDGAAFIPRPEDVFLVDEELTETNAWERIREALSKLEGGEG
jgi:hypothetical protein